MLPNDFPNQGTYQIAQLKKGGYKVSLMAIDISSAAPVHTGKLMQEHIEERHSATFEEIFSVSFMVFLGWSPILRQKVGKIRPTEKHGQDSEMARVVELKLIRGIQAEITRFHNDVKEFDFFQDTGEVLIPESLLKIEIKRLTRTYEVETASVESWRKAIKKSYELWEAVKQANGGYLYYDLTKNTLEFQESK